MSFFVLQRDMSALREAGSLAVAMLRFILSPEGQSLLAAYDFSPLPTAVATPAAAELGSVFLAAGVTRWSFESSYVVGAGLLLGAGAGASVVSDYRMSLSDYNLVADAYTNIAAQANTSALQAQVAALQARLDALAAAQDPPGVTLLYRKEAVAGLVLGALGLACGLAALGMVAWARAEKDAEARKAREAEEERRSAQAKREAVASGKILIPVPMMGTSSTAGPGPSWQRGGAGSQL